MKEKQESNPGRQSDDGMRENSMGKTNLKRWVLSFERNVETVMLYRICCYVMLYLHQQIGKKFFGTGGGERPAASLTVFTGLDASLPETFFVTPTQELAFSLSISASVPKSDVTSARFARVFAVS